MNIHIYIHTSLVEFHTYPRLVYQICLSLHLSGDLSLSQIIIFKSILAVLVPVLILFFIVRCLTSLVEFLTLQIVMEED